MLRPQVFALQEGEVQVGLICSEKQAIDATLVSLQREDARFRPIADKYWNARGGSHTDGGAFIFSLKDAKDGSGKKQLICTDKFGKVIETPRDKVVCDVSKKVKVKAAEGKTIEEKLDGLFAETDSSAANKIFTYVRDAMSGFDAEQVQIRD